MNAREGGPSGRTSALPGFSVFREHRLVVVVGEWIVEPEFDHRFCGFRRVAGGIDPHAVGFPQSEVAQDAFDDGGFVDEGDDAQMINAS